MELINKVLSCESENKEHIHLFLQKGTWYAFDNSAYLLSQTQENVKPELCVFNEHSIWLVKTALSEELQNFICNKLSVIKQTSTHIVLCAKNICRKESLSDWMSLVKKRSLLAVDTPLYT